MPSLAHFRDDMPSGGQIQSSGTLRNNMNAIYQGDMYPLKVVAQDTPDDTVKVLTSDIGNYYKQVWLTPTQPLDFDEANSGAISEPTSNDRIALVSVNSGGALSWTYGTQASSPTPPDCPSGDLPLAYVYQRKNKTTIYNFEDDNGEDCYIYRDVRPALIGNTVLLTGNQTVAGIKTFSSFPVTPSSAPTTDYQVANKKYVDDNSGDPINNILIVVDEKTAGTNGGTFTSGAWRTRDLNTVRHNTISGASLANNQIKLPAGTYDIRASAPAGSGDENLNNHQAKLRNITDGADVIIGTSEYMRGMSYGGDSARGQTRSFIEGVFTITNTKAFEIQHRCNSSSHFGYAANFGVVEIYTQVFIQKIG